MAYKSVRPIFRQSEEEIERRVNQRLEEQARSLKEEIAGKIEERTKPLEDIARTLQEERLEKQKERQARDMQDHIDKLADERANKLADERANKLADERANKLADERANKLADERAKTLAEKLAEEKANKLVDERANKLADERAKTLAEKLAEEKANKLAEEKANKLAEEKANKLAEEKAKTLAEKLVEEKANKLAEEKTKQQTPASPVQHIPNVTQAQSPDTSSKIAKMIEEIKKRKASIPSPVQTPIQDQIQTVEHAHNHTTGRLNIPIVSQDQVIDDGVSCPTCHNGHVHAVESDGVTYKCTGPNCGKEYVMVDKTADYKCVGCGSPIKKPEDEKMKMDSCPFCHGKKAVKFDWGKVWKVQKPSMLAKR